MLEQDQIDELRERFTSVTIVLHKYSLYILMHFEKLMYKIQ